jgi:hypothetical protein
MRFFFSIEKLVGALKFLSNVVAVVVVVDVVVVAFDNHSFSI